MIEGLLKYSTNNSGTYELYHIIKYVPLPNKLYYEIINIAEKNTEFLKVLKFIIKSNNMPIEMQRILAQSRKLFAWYIYICNDVERPKKYINLDIKSKIGFYTLFQRNSWRSDRRRKELIQNFEKLPLLITKEIGFIITKESGKQLDKYLSKVVRNILLVINYDSHYNLNIELKEGHALKQINQEAIFAIKSIAGKQFDLNDEEQDLLIKNHPELLNISLILKKHYESIEANEHNEIVTNGVTHFIRHEGGGKLFKYKEIFYLIKNFGLPRSVAARWMKTLEYERIPKIIGMDKVAIKKRLKLISASILNAGGDIKIPIIIKRIIQQLDELNMDEIIDELKILKKLATKEHNNDVVKFSTILIKEIESQHVVEDYLVSDDYNFLDAHNIGERWGSCQSWSSKSNYNRSLMAFVYDATKKYILIKDAKNKNRWFARAILHLARNSIGRWVMVLDNNNYFTNSEQQKLIIEFARKKARLCGLRLIIGLKKSYTLYGKTPHVYSDTQRGITTQRYRKIKKYSN
jgi:hypothetical protein